MFYTHPTLESTLEAGVEVKSLVMGVPEYCGCLIHNGLAGGPAASRNEQNRKTTSQRYQVSHFLFVMYLSGSGPR